MTSDEGQPSSRQSASSRDRRATGLGDANKAAKLRMLIQKKERLKYAVETLELQSRQRERELRKSMAAQ